MHVNIEYRSDCLEPYNTYLLQHYTVGCTIPVVN